MARVKMEISFTELDSFRRLVQFVEDVDSYACAEVDLALQDIVSELREDLAEMRRR